MIPQMLGILRKNKLLLSLSTLLLFLSFSVNMLGAMSNASFLGNFKDSERLVVNDITCKASVFGGQLAESKNPAKDIRDKCDVAGLEPYSSQYGLQGRIFALVYKIMPSFVHSHQFVVLAELTTALLSAICFALLILWARQRFGLIPAVTVTFLIAISPMVVGFARNLYWALPSMLAPFIYALYLYDLRRSTKAKIFFWVGLGVLFTIRFLCGYEYLTTLSIMAMAALAYHLYISRETWRVAAKQFALVLAVSVLGFVAALSVHIITLSFTAGSIANAAHIVKQRALERTANTDAYLQYPIQGLKTNLPDIYAIANAYLGLDSHAQGHSHFWAFAAAGINYAFIPVVNIPISLMQPFAAFAQSLTVFIILLSLAYKYRRKLFASNFLREVKALYAGATVGLIGFLTWLILAPSHSLVHAHINGILIYLPFALFGYMIIGIYVQTLIAKIKKR